jgi:hypothetical protein
MSLERRDGRDYYRARTEDEAKIRTIRVWYTFTGLPAWNRDPHKPPLDGLTLEEP